MKLGKGSLIRKESAKPSTLEFPPHWRFCGTGTGFHQRSIPWKEDKGPPLLTGDRLERVHIWHSAPTQHNLPFALLHHYLGVFLSGVLKTLMLKAIISLWSLSALREQCIQPKASWLSAHQTSYFTRNAHLRMLAHEALQNQSVPLPIRSD